MRRRSFLKALVLGAAVAFPVARLKVQGGETSDWDDVVHIGKRMEEEDLGGYIVPDAIARKMVEAFEKEMTLKILAQPASSPIYRRVPGR